MAPRMPEPKLTFYTKDETLAALPNMEPIMRFLQEKDKRVCPLWKSDPNF